MKALLFKRAMKYTANDGKEVRFPPNSWAILPDKLALEIRDKFAGQSKGYVLQAKNINEWFRDYKYPSKNPVLFLRTGGIGDICALSTIFAELDNRITLATMPQYRAVIQWMNRQPDIIKDVTRAVYEGMSHGNWLRHFQNTRYANWEGHVENFQTRNWYEIFCDGIELPFRPELGRPDLTTERIVATDKMRPQLCQNSLLICHRASTYMRTVELHTVLKAVEASRFAEWKLYIHEQNLLPAERELLDEWPRKVNIIPRGTMHQCLLDWYDAGFVLTCDSGAIHFREGVQRPALAMYASFHPESRTKYYQYTRSAYFHSLCPDQPCFLHETAEIKSCPAGKDIAHAPCLGKEWNPSLWEDIAKTLDEVYPA